MAVRRATSSDSPRHRLPGLPAKGNASAVQRATSSDSPRHHLPGLPAYRTEQNSFLRQVARCCEPPHNWTLPCGDEPHLLNGPATSRIISTAVFRRKRPSFAERDHLSPTMLNAASERHRTDRVRLSQSASRAAERRQPPRRLIRSYRSLAHVLVSGRRSRRHDGKSLKQLDCRCFFGSRSARRLH